MSARPFPSREPPKPPRVAIRVTSAAPPLLLGAAVAVQITAGWGPAGAERWLGIATFAASVGAIHALDRVDRGQPSALLGAMAAAAAPWYGAGLVSLGTRPLDAVARATITGGALATGALSCGVAMALLVRTLSRLPAGAKPNWGRFATLGLAGLPAFAIAAWLTRAALPIPGSPVWLAAPALAGTLLPFSGRALTRRRDGTLTTLAAFFGGLGLAAFVFAAWGWTLARPGPVAWLAPLAGALSFAPLVATASFGQQASPEAASVTRSWLFRATFMAILPIALHIALAR